jgi:hypothetical protein
MRERMISYCCLSTVIRLYESWPRFSLEACEVSLRLWMLVRNGACRDTAGQLLGRAFASPREVAIRDDLLGTEPGFITPVPWPKPSQHSGRLKEEFIYTTRQRESGRGYKRQCRPLSSSQDVASTQEMSVALLKDINCNWQWRNVAISSTALLIEVV